MLLVIATAREFTLHRSSGRAGTTSQVISPWSLCGLRRHGGIQGKQCSCLPASVSLLSRTPTIKIERWNNNKLRNDGGFNHIPLNGQTRVGGCPNQQGGAVFPQEWDDPQMRILGLHPRPMHLDCDQGCFSGHCRSAMVGLGAAYNKS